MESDTPSIPQPPRARQFRRGLGLRADLLLALALGTVALAFQHRLLYQLPIGVDHTLQFSEFYALRWQGGPPLWYPQAMNGSPLVDNMQAALLYPPRWPFFFIPDWRAWYGLFEFLHTIIALAGAALLARTLGLARIPAAVCALLFACGGAMAGRILNPALLHAGAWLPILLAGAVRGDRRGGWLTALAVAMIAAVGSIHTLIYGAIAYTLAIVLFPFAPLARRSPAAAARLLLGRAGYWLLGLLWASPTLIPGALRVGESLRMLADSAAPASAPLPDFPPLAIFLGGSGGQIHPEYIDLSCYVGPLGAGLVLLGLVRGARRRDPRALFAFLMAAVGLLFVFAESLGLAPLLRAIPGLRLVLGPGRALILPALGFALLAALAVESPSPRLLHGFGALAGVCGLAAAGSGAFRLWGLPTSDGVAPFLDDWLRVLTRAPAAVRPDLWRLLDAALILPAAALALFLLARRPRIASLALALILALQLWHFSPRVAPPLRPASYYDPTPQARFLRAARDADSAHPFRVAGYDALRIHPFELENLHALTFLMPNIATLWGLDDAQGYDPLIYLRWRRAFESTAGLSPAIDPLRTLEFAAPDPALMRLTGLRFLVGHPYDRRVTTLPLTLDAADATARVGAWGAERGDRPVTAWRFVSALDAPEYLPFALPVAELILHADEGTFTFPIRNGIETAQIDLPASARRMADPALTATMNSRWISHQPSARHGYEIPMANWRGSIATPPIHLRRVEWRLLRTDAALIVYGQAARLQRPAPEEDPWRLVLGAETDIAPVFEFLPATPRAGVVPVDPAGSSRLLWHEDLLGTARPAAFTLYNNDRRVIRADAAKPSLLLIRETFTPGWRATVNGNPAPVLAVNDLLQGVPIPAGGSVIELRYRPRLPAALLALSLLTLSGTIFIQRRYFGSP